MIQGTNLPADSLTLPRFCGLASFMRVPTSETAQGADVAIVGLPSDSGGPYRTGARFGPAAVRSQSVMLRQVNPYRGNLNIFEAMKIVDVGDSPVVPGYLEQSMAHIEKTVDAIAGAGAIPWPSAATTRSACPNCAPWHGIMGPSPWSTGMPIPIPGTTISTA